MTEKKTKPPAERMTYRVSEVVERLGISRTKIFEMMRDGELPFVKLGGLTLIRREDLQALLERHTSRAA